MNKAKCKAVRKDIDAALAKVLKKHGLKGSLRNLGFSSEDGGITVKKFEITPILNEAESAIAIEKKFVLACAMYGFKRADFGREVSVGGTLVRFVGFNTTRHKNSIAIEGLDGKSYMTTPSNMRRALRLADAHAEHTATLKG
jgi:hypothetical protein